MGSKQRPARPTCPATTAVLAKLQEEAKVRKEAHHYTAGLLTFGGLLFAAGAAAWSLPLVFILFVAVCLPWRAVDFVKQKWIFFLIDFCYFVCLAAAVYLTWFPDDMRAEALVYALADGPVAGALVAWQCPWLFGSAEHTVSVLMHLLPGLAVFAHRYFTPSGIRGWWGMQTYAQQLLHGQLLPTGSVPRPRTPEQPLKWLLAAPLLFYVVWQLCYFLVVQVCCRSLILRDGYETSYTCLARRAQKTNNIWNRLVRRGGIMRRCCMYGLLQLGFTVICSILVLPTYFCFPLGFAFQVAKFVFPVYYGSRYQMTKVPQHVFLQGMQHLDAVRQEQGAAAGAAGDTPTGKAAGEAAPMAFDVTASAEAGLRMRRSCCASEAERFHSAPLMPRPLLA